MHQLFTRLILIGTTAATMMLSGCGGSKGTAAPPTVSGIAATGLPIAGQVYLKDSAATPKELSAPTGKDGSYVINVSALRPHSSSKCSGPPTPTAPNLLFLSQVLPVPPISILFPILLLPMQPA